MEWWHESDRQKYWCTWWSSGAETEYTAMHVMDWTSGDDGGTVGPVQRTLLWEGVDE